MPTSQPVTEIPVTVVGGYLGAGKTTLVNHVLRTAQQRIAVLVNDFGDIAIDQELIVAQDGDTITLANGCICCSLVDGFSAALTTIAAVEPAPERLVIESSGVADPASVAAYGHAPGFQLDATIVVVDAETVRAKSVDRYVGDTVLRQLGSGDIVVINKTDLLEPAALATMRTWLCDHAPDAVLVPAERGAVDPALLFGVVESARMLDPRHSGEHRADNVFGSWTWTSDQPCDRARVDELMNGLPDEIVRVKGVLRLGDDQDQAWILQRVGRRWSLRRAESALEDGCRLVVIGIGQAVSPDVLKLFALLE